jgi:hypothetical protein
LAPLPDGYKPEGIASDGGSGFFVCSVRGRVWHHNLATKQGSPVVGSEVSAPILALTGLKYCPQQRALFLAGAMHARGYIFYLKQASNGTFSVTRRVTIKFPPGSYVNDVALGPQQAFFSDSWNPKLHAIPRFPNGSAPYPQLTTYTLVGMPPAPPPLLASNGLAVLPADNSSSSRNTTTVVIAHWASGGLYTVQLQQGRATTQAVAVPTTIAGRRSGLDGVITQGRRTVYVGDNLNNRVIQYRLSPDLRSANVSCVIASRSFDGTGTVALAHGRLWATNMRFTSCFLLSDCRDVAFTVAGVNVTEYCSR